MFWCHNSTSNKTLPHYEGQSSLIRANIGSSHPLVAFRTETIWIERVEHNCQATEDSITKHDYEVTWNDLNIDVYVRAWVRPLAHCTMVHPNRWAPEHIGERKGREGKYKQTDPRDPKSKFHEKVCHWMQRSNGEIDSGLKAA